MKKILALVTLLALLACTGCGAANHLQAVTADGLSLSVPDHLVVFTRDMAEDDPLLVSYDTNSQGITRGLSARSSYAYIFDEDMTFGLDLCRISSPTEDYKSLDAQGREDLVSEYAAALPEGSQVQCLTLNGELWIHYGLPTDQGYMAQWATNRNNRLYYATLTAGDQAAAQAQAPWIQEMLTGISFGE